TSTIYRTSNNQHTNNDQQIITIGKHTKPHQYGRLPPLGIKIALFDVVDVTNPVTIDTFSIGGQGTDSKILSEPKAFLFDKEKNILSIPIFQQYYGGHVPLEGGIGESNSGSTTSGEDAGKPIGIVPPRYIPPNNWKGFYVFGVDPVKGFTLRGIVEHYNGTSYNYSFGSRSFYIDD